MYDEQSRILDVLRAFTGRDGEPKNEVESYMLKAMWLMMLSEFEASVKQKAENYIDKIKKKDISNIHICLLIRHFHDKSEDTLTADKIVGFYKKDPREISYRNFTKDKVPKYKTKAVEKLFNNMGIFFTSDELASLSILDSVASTRDSIAHGDIDVQITRKELEDQLHNLSELAKMLEEKLI